MKGEAVVVRGLPVKPDTSNARAETDGWLLVTLNQPIKLYLN